MYKNVLVVFSKQDSALRARIEDDGLDGLRDAAGNQVVVHSARHASDARHKSEQLDLQFAIVGHRLSEDARSPVEDDAGIALCAALRARGATHPIVLMLPYVASMSNALMVRCRELDVIPFNDGADAAPLICRQVADFQPPPRTLDVTLRLRPDAPWRYELLGNRFSYHCHGELQVDADKMDLARTLSHAIGAIQGDEWYSSFEDLGRSLTRSLCEATPFRDELARGIELAGGIERARIAFSLGQGDRRHYPIALEALFPPAKYTDVPWMVRAPLYRNVHSGAAAATAPLALPERPLRVLLVAAEADGYVDALPGTGGRALRLDVLPRVQRECEGLQRLMQPRQREGVVRELTLLRPRRDGRLSKAQLLDTLESQDWNVVHFAGHSLAREDGDRESRGYLFVGGPGEPEPVAIDEVAPFLRRTSMVYLSCCESNSPAFAIELARNGVPIVIGYRWAVDDRFAALHAHLFFRHLFQQRRVETAFLHTRRALHRRFSRRDRVWASSMLVFGGDV